MSSAVLKLRRAIRNKESISLSPEGKDVGEATALIIDGEEIPLSEKTDFIGNDNTNQTLRAIYQCWLNNESSTTEYIAACEKNKIPVISFMERTELISFLNGSSETCSYLKVDAAALNEFASSSKSTGKSEGADNENKDSKKRKIELDPFLKEILANERDLVDHNKALRGSKPVDFSSVAKECEYKIIRLSKSDSTSGSSKAAATAYKSSSSSSSVPKPAAVPRHRPSSSTSTSSVVTAPAKNKDPIIILSPSASSILTMNNVKEFLQDGKFVDTTDMPMSAKNMLQLSRDSKKFNRKMKFLVVSNVDKFFTKPEYWDRVVAVFTTGQEWQFKNYKYSQPNDIFQKYKGFYIHYNGDIVPPKINSWNVQTITIDRNQRFKDRQTSEFLWESLEKFMSTKGYK
ncbi:hypothetical protein CANARDRAFT_26760 [[Candida] arabinofermentans NRRL YB-2248]|uniref:Cell division control protein 73 C-terminal domain-containing protein n=1 Tax=[Candida] arabinofermentans NRRL YB-2248 TaxID=983967 RepID=A0A1E4T6R5_9ASCO|nr:hypothetical protein CANARDRAFT_26760 [[Candida] arabinofermentans NRRL YB-2248]